MNIHTDIYIYIYLCIYIYICMYVYIYILYVCVLFFSSQVYLKLPDFLKVTVLDLTIHERFRLLPVALRFETSLSTHRQATSSLRPS